MTDAECGCNLLTSGKHKQRNGDSAMTEFEKMQEKLRNAPRKVLNPKTGRMVTVKPEKKQEKHK